MFVDKDGKILKDTGDDGNAQNITQTANYGERRELYRYEFYREGKAPADRQSVVARAGARGGGAGVHRPLHTSPQMGKRR